MPGLLHVTFGGGGARIEILENHFFQYVGATVDKSLACCFEEHGYLGVAQ